LLQLDFNNRIFSWPVDQATVGFIYKFNELNFMFIQPIFRYHVTTLQGIEDYQDNLYNVGFELGLRKVIE